MSGVGAGSVVLASGNPGKLAELSTLLSPLGWQVRAQSEFHLREAEEPHPTFIENALAKARHASFHTGLPALADDSGLCVNALNGLPGVRSARFAPLQDAPRTQQDAANNALLLQQLDGVDIRAARFVCVIVALRHAADPEPLIAQGELIGQIGLTGQGQGGFGYDPLFVLPDGRTLAQCTAQEKNRISHRGQAIRALLPLLQSVWGRDTSV
ncbi:MAG: RdgB/HAM1 family non-canonical purine NTP pyrophosphatase [Thiomonas sp.]|nr:RdgB/HAM1 family non-canonical purine NTP pyrophosphatase [Thiomonas sp.]